MQRLYKHHYIEKQATYKGLPYTILFNCGGFRTAYIDVTSTELKYIDYEKIDLWVHGGLSYSASYLPYESGKIIDSSKWYIGWDYAHYEDGIDMNTVNKYFGECSSPWVLATFSHKNFKCFSIDEVESDCLKAIDDIVNHIYNI